MCVKTPNRRRTTETVQDLDTVTSVWPSHSETPSQVIMGGADAASTPPTDHLSVRTWSGSPLSGLHDSCFQRCGSWTLPPVTISGVGTGADFNLFTFLKVCFTVFHCRCHRSYFKSLTLNHACDFLFHFLKLSCFMLPVFIL